MLNRWESEFATQIWSGYQKSMLNFIENELVLPEFQKTCKDEKGRKSRVLLEIDRNSEELIFDNVSLHKMMNQSDQ